MEYIKNNYKLLGAIVLLIVALFATYLQNRQEVKEMKSSTEIAMYTKDSLHVRDSIATVTLQVKLDSLYQESRNVATADVNTSVTKKGLSTVVIVTETKQPDGTVTKTTKTVTIDTTEIASSRIQTVIDSMKKQLATHRDSATTITVTMHDTTKVIDKDIKYVHDTLSRTVTNPEKKLEFSATAGLNGNLSSSNTTIKPNVVPALGFGATYAIAPPFFLTAGVSAQGNLIKYPNWTNYSANAAIGFTVKF